MQPITNNKYYTIEYTLDGEHWFQFEEWNRFEVTFPEFANEEDAVKFLNEEILADEYKSYVSLRVVFVEVSVKTTEIKRADTIK